MLEFLFSLPFHLLLTALLLLHFMAIKHGNNFTY